MTLTQWPGAQSRAEYLDTQIARSAKKFRYCKVSAWDVAKYRRVIRNHARRARAASTAGPILCLGTRNGREVDLFRHEWFGPAVWRHAVRVMERYGAQAFGARLPAIEGFGRSRVDHLDVRSVVGVEINPQAARRDVRVGSFDELPAAWSGLFGIVFSNSFDHAYDPVATAREWRRVLRPGGYLILCCNTDQIPTLTDPTAGLDVPTLQELFGGAVVFAQPWGSRAGYTELILRC